jgi:uncharacterized metal-binding protein YceD (DUF177 family)
MIAPAMNTRPDESLPYLDLARQKARISRQIRLEHLPRLAALSAAGSDAVLDVTLTFRFDPEGQVRVFAEVTGTLVVDCTGCAESREFALALNFECAVAESEEQAEDFSHSDDVVVADGSEIAVVTIVEDEILLNLPERLCISLPCERAPSMHYPISEPAAESEQATEDDEAAENPFGILATLKNSMTKTPEQ